MDEHISRNAIGVCNNWAKIEYFECDLNQVPKDPNDLQDLLFVTLAWDESDLPSDPKCV